MNLPKPSYLNAQPLERKFAKELDRITVWLAKRELWKNRRRKPRISKAQLP